MDDYLDEPQKPKQKRRGCRIFAIIGLVIMLVAAGFIFYKFYFVFGSGVKAGELNLFVYKGYVFKTYEGRLIQAGYNSRNSCNTIQSNEFNFSVTDEEVARQLERSAGKFVELHYKEYLGALPWRGMTKYVVDSVLSITEVNPPSQTPIDVPAELLE